MKTTASASSRVSTPQYTPPDLTVPESAADRHQAYSRAILAAVKLMESRLSSTNPDEAVDAAKTLIHLEETRLRHDRAVADAPPPKPPSKTSELPPIRPIRRPTDLVGAEIDCWFGDGMMDILSGAEDTPVSGDPRRKLREKLTLADPSATWTDEEISRIFGQLMILKAEEDQAKCPQSRNPRV